MRPVELQRLAEGAEHGGRGGEVVRQSVRQPRGRPEAGQIHGDDLALGRQDVHDRVPGLPVVTDAVQQEQRFAAAHARVVDGHGPRAVRGRTLNETVAAMYVCSSSGTRSRTACRQLVSNCYRRVAPSCGTCPTRLDSTRDVGWDGVVSTDTVTDVFEEHRPVLVGVAYRMLGRVADAEDVVQEAWLRWSGADRSEVREPRGYLVRVTTRLAIDRLRQVKARNEAYVGPWLPEPYATDFGDTVPDTAERAVLADSVSSPSLSSWSPCRRWSGRCSC